MKSVYSLRQLEGDSECLGVICFPILEIKKIICKFYIFMLMYIVSCHHQNGADLSNINSDISGWECY